MPINSIDEIIALHELSTRFLWRDASDLVTLMRIGQKPKCTCEITPEIMVADSMRGFHVCPEKP